MSSVWWVADESAVSRLAQLRISILRVGKPIRFGIPPPTAIRFAGGLQVRKSNVAPIPGSSNGRTAPFGGAYRGSNPRPGAF